LLQVEFLQKNKQIFRQETPKPPRVAEKDFFATLGDFDEVRRIKLFLFGCGLSALSNILDMGWLVTSLRAFLSEAIL
jgi:hypothetical protein